MNGNYPRRRRALVRAVAIATLLSAFASSAQAELRLPAYIGSGMVLQRETNNDLWGWADPGERVVVRMGSESYATTAGDDGRWSIQLPVHDAGGPYTITIQAKDREVLKDVYFGDVWVCAGQSNMELPMRRVAPKYPDVIANSESERIRYFGVGLDYTFTGPQQDYDSGKWVSTTPESVLDYSAAGYFFARSLQKHENVPIGLIGVAIGGSPVESWMSKEALAPYPELLKSIEAYRDPEVVKKINAADNAIQSDWRNNLDKNDPGLSGSWFSPDTDVSDWGTITLPGFWDEGGVPNQFGSVWFRRTIELPESYDGSQAKLELGTIVDADVTYINGQEVGNTGYQYPPRRYTVPAGLLHPGENTIVVRGITDNNRGNFTKDKPFKLIADGETYEMRGEWRWKVGATVEAKASPTWLRWKPEGLYNGMITPLFRKNVRGVLWYQGESNTGNADVYAERLGRMIDAWRKGWGNPELPFIIAQLPLLGPPSADCTENGWATLRDQERLTAENTPFTGLAVMLDLGEWNDIHPLNKSDVGHRLALVACNLVYGDSSIVGFPVPEAAVIEGEGAVRVHFKNEGAGLSTSDSKAPGHFALAGKDGVYHPAEAKIDACCLLVHSDEVPHPVSVRYAWAMNPKDANLTNKAGLPASPFQLKVIDPSEDSAEEQ